MGDGSNTEQRDQTDLTGAGVRHVAATLATLDARRTGVVGVSADAVAEALRQRDVDASVRAGDSDEKHDRVVVIGDASQSLRPEELVEHGFIRRTDVEATASGHRVSLWERMDLSAADVARHYERVLASYEERAQRGEAEAVEARHRLLIQRDHAVGTEAEIGRLNRDIISLSEQLSHATKRGKALTRRKEGLTTQVESLRGRLAALQKSNQGLQRRLGAAEQQLASRTSFGLRLARRLRGGAR